MDEEIILSKIKGFYDRADVYFPEEYLSIFDKFRLSKCVRDEYECWEREGQAHKTGSTNFIKQVLFRMKDMGYKPSSEVLDTDNNYVF